MPVRVDAWMHGSLRAGVDAWRGVCLLDDHLVLSPRTAAPSELARRLCRVAEQLSYAGDVPVRAAEVHGVVGRDGASAGSSFRRGMAGGLTMLATVHINVD